jgi:hypothetical protein
MYDDIMKAESYAEVYCIISKMTPEEIEELTATLQGKPTASQSKQMKDTVDALLAPNAPELDKKVVDKLRSQGRTSAPVLTTEEANRLNEINNKVKQMNMNPKLSTQDKRDLTTIADNRRQHQSKINQFKDVMNPPQLSTTPQMTPKKKIRRAKRLPTGDIAYSRGTPAKVQKIPQGNIRPDTEPQPMSRRVKEVLQRGKERGGVALRSEVPQRTSRFRRRNPNEQTTQRVRRRQPVTVNPDA